MNPIDEEFAFHLDRTATELEEGGMDPDEARREAQRRFGSVDRYRRRCRRARTVGLPWPGRTALRAIAQDVRWSLRTVRRAPAFFLTAAATLAVGVGASTTIFSVVDTVVFRPLPYAESDRLVQVGTIYSGDRLSSTSPMNFFDWQAESDAFESLIGSRMQSMTLTGRGDPERYLAAGVSAGFFELLGQTPLHGRTILESDDRQGGRRVVVLRYGLWQRRWGGDPDIVGRTLRLSGQVYTIVGIMPESFHPPEAIGHGDVEMWFPLAFVSDDLTSRGGGILQVLGRLRSGVTDEQASASLNALQRQIYEREPPSSAQVARLRQAQRIGVAPLHEQTVGDNRDTLLIFLGAVVFLLLIACANVANLFLAQATGREREIAVRAALGAGRARIVQQLLTESVITALAGGAAGAALAGAGVSLFRTLAPEGIPRLAEMAVDLRVLGFTLVISLASGILFGLAPALRQLQVAAADAMKEGAANLTAGRQRHLVRRGLVIGEIAISLVLLAGAGLLLNSFVRRINVDPGFDPDGVVRMAVYLDGYETDESRIAFIDQLVDAVSALPGVTSAAATDNLPMTRNNSTSSVTIEGRTPEPADPPWIKVHRITEGFFETLRIPVLAGRTYGPADVAAPVAVINNTMADAYWPTESAIGRRFKFGAADAPGPWYEVVGMVAEIDQRGLGEASGPAVYLPHGLRPLVFGNVIARSEGDPTAVITGMRSALKSVDPNLPTEQIGTLRDQMRTTVVEPRFYTWLLSSFALVAVILAGIGIYSAVAFSVGQRTREIGVRMALGAGGGTVVRMVLREGLALAFFGMGLGFVGVSFLARTLSGFVYGIEPTDIPTFVGVGSMLAAVVLIATWIPAHRATDIDPIEILRTE